VDKGLPVDLLTLSEELERSGSLDEVGGAAYLSSLMDGVPKNPNVEYYAKIIKEKSLLRMLILSSPKSSTQATSRKKRPTSCSTKPRRLSSRWPNRGQAGVRGDRQLTAQRWI